MSFICEYCGKKHSGNFGSGRFCNSSCQKSYAGTFSGGSRPNRGLYSKSKKYLEYKDGIISESRWICNYKNCGLMFITRAHLLIHKKEKGHAENLTKWKEKSYFKCEFCGKSGQYIKSHQVNHTNHCKLNPNRKISPFERKKLSDDHRTKIRLGTIKYLTSINKFGYARFSEKACIYMDKLNIQNSWNLIHAKNGGEFRIDGYSVDGYDKDKNIIFEYDEPKHYINIENNLLNEKDIYRQNYIIRKLNCEFWRYNEAKNYLYKVN